MVTLVVGTNVPLTSEEILQNPQTSPRGVGLKALS